MFGSIGLPEVLMILVIALLIFGPKRLPEIGRTIGKGLAEFRRASSDIKRTVNAELALDEDESPPMARRPSVATPRVSDDGADAPAKESEVPPQTAASAVAETAVARKPREEVESSTANESSAKDAASAEGSAGRSEDPEAAAGDAAATR